MTAPSTNMPSIWSAADGKHDGLYWPVTKDEKESPLGPLMAKATAEGYFDKTDPKKHEHAPVSRLLL